MTERKKWAKRIRRSLNARLETGFSMLEAVVVVGVLLALAVGGFLAYGPITQNAKIAKMKSAASEVIQQLWWLILTEIQIQIHRT
jgi:type II secretory pathway pseudopilin PulG